MTALSNLLALLSLDDSDYLAGISSSQSATGDFVNRLSNIGGAVVVGGLTAAATAVTAVGIAAWDAGNTMDEAMDNIAVATGAVGPELDALRGDFEAVFTSVPTDAQAAADVIGILNSRLDATGPELQGIAGPLLEVTRMMKGDLTSNAENFTRVMGDWSLPLDDAASYLDALYVAAQQTGAPLDQLMERVVQYGAPMRNFGFNFNQAAGILASFEAQGVNTEIVMSGLRVAQGKFINSGKDMATGLWETIDAIQNAEDSTKALAIANDVFGARAAGDMFDTIRAGKFDIGDLVTTMMNADGAIMEAADSTADWGEKWQKFQNQITVALAPIGEKMMEGVGRAMGSVIAIFESPEVQAGLTRFTEMVGAGITQAVEYIPVLIDGFFQFVDFLQNNQGIVIGILAALGVAAIAWGVTTAAAAWTAMAPLLPVIAVLVAIAAVAYLAYQAWTNNWGGIRDLMTDLWNTKLKPVFDQLQAWLSVAIPSALQFLSDLWNNTLLPAIRTVWSFLQAYVFPILGAVANVISAVLGVAIKAIAGYIANVWLPNFQKAIGWIRENVLPVIKNVASWLNEKLGPAFRWVGEKVGELTGWLNDLADRLRNMSLPDWMTPGSPTPWELGLLGVQETMESLSRTTLPQFEASLALQPVGAAALELPGRNVPVDTGSPFSDANNGDDALQRELLRTLKNLPETIARVVRDEQLKRRG